MSIRNTLRRQAAGYAILAGLAAACLILLGAGLATWPLR